MSRAVLPLCPLEDLARRAPGSSTATNGVLNFSVLRALETRQPGRDRLVPSAPGRSSWRGVLLKLALLWVVLPQAVWAQASSPLLLRNGASEVDFGPGTQLSSYLDTASPDRDYPLYQDDAVLPQDIFGLDSASGSAPDSLRASPDSVHSSGETDVVPPTVAVLGADSLTEPDLDALVSLYEEDSPTPGRTSDLDLSQLDLSSFSIPVELGPDVVRWLEYYALDGHRFFRRWLERSARYVPLIEEALLDAGLPAELAYVPLIESGYVSHATSPMRAAGIWQFMPDTARRYGLTSNRYVDERRDPERATQAAIDLFIALQRRFGDWCLTLAAYNAGEGRILKAMARTGASDYWRLARTGVLRPETRYYVARFLAAAIIARNPDLFGFDNLQYESVLRYDLVEVSSSTPLSRIAMRLGVDVEVLEELNPELRGAQTPPYPYELRLPPGTSALLEPHLMLEPGGASAAGDISSGATRHQVARGQTLGSISRVYGVSVTALRSANRLQGDRLRLGQTLRIPLKPMPQPSLEPELPVELGTSAGEPEGWEPELVTVDPGDSLARIARRQGVSETSLRRWNGLAEPLEPTVGERLVIYSEQTQPPALDPTDYLLPSRRIHPVVAGETLLTVARRYGLNPEDILQANRELRAGTPLRPGAILKIPVW